MTVIDQINKLANLRHAFWIRGGRQGGLYGDMEYRFVRGLYVRIAWLWDKRRMELASDKPQQGLPDNDIKAVLARGAFLLGG